MGVLTGTHVLGVIPGHPAWGGRPTPLVAGTSAVITDPPFTDERDGATPSGLLSASGCNLPSRHSSLPTLTDQNAAYSLADAVTPQILTSAC